MDAETPRDLATPPRRIADLPGPRAWPLLGNLPQLDIPALHQQLERWAAAHGPVYRLRFGIRDVVVVAQPELIAAILRDRPEGWRRLQTMAAVIHELNIDGLFTAEQDAWRRQRRLVAAAFTPGHLKRFFPLIERVTERLKERLDHAARTDATIDLQALLMRYTVDVTASLAFGVDVNTLQQDGNTLQEHVDKVLPMVMRRMNAAFPHWRYVKLPSDHAFERHLAACHAAVRGFVEAARERIAADPALADRPTNLLEAMLAARDTDGAALSEQEVAGNVFTMLLAGEDSTANTLAWSLYLLHGHPEAWRAVVADVDAALGADTLPRTLETAATLTSLEECSNESMRLRPIAPLSYLENNRPTEIGGVALPAGTFVICVMRCGAVDPARAADAPAFRPERWRAPADAPQDAPPDRRLIAAAMPFGAGPRICPGRYVAMLEMKMVLATIARNYQLVEVGTATGAPPRELMAFAMSPVGLRMRIRAR